MLQRCSASLANSVLCDIMLQLEVDHSGDSYITGISGVNVSDTTELN